MIGGPGAIRLISKTTTEGSSPATSYIERIGLTVKAIQDNVSVDPRMVGYFQELRPVIYARPGARFLFYFGVRDNANSDPNYTLVREYIVGETDTLSLYLSGRFLDMKVQETGSDAWTFTEYELEVEPLSVIA